MYTIGMNKLSPERRARVISALVEGNSIRATCRMTGAAKGTVLKLLADVGETCAKFHAENVVDVPSRRVQCDEIWSFCYAKAKNVPAEKKGEFGYGDVWTWTAIDADSKLCVSWLIGTRDLDTAREFMEDVAKRLQYRVQLTTDGHKPYFFAVDAAFGGGVDYDAVVRHGEFTDAAGGAGGSGDGTGEPARPAVDDRCTRADCRGGWVEVPERGAGRDGGVDQRDPDEDVGGWEGRCDLELAADGVRGGCAWNRKGGIRPGPEWFVRGEDDGVGGQEFA